jgi:hypothetical protein
VTILKVSLKREVSSIESPLKKYLISVPRDIVGARTCDLKIVTTESIADPNTLQDLMRSLDPNVEMPHDCGKFQKLLVSAKRFGILRRVIRD